MLPANVHFAHFSVIFATNIQKKIRYWPEIVGYADYHDYI
jgi:hypothetical protein